MEDYSQLSNQQDSTALNIEILQYRKKNLHLKRRLREKDIKIQQLFGYIDNASRRFNPSEIASVKKNASRHQKLHHSEHQNKEKENKIYRQNEHNIFKQESFSMIDQRTPKELQLPVLDRRSKNIFVQDRVLENPQRKTKIYKIPLQKLKPLNSQQVKKRFLSRFQVTQEYDPQ